MEVVVTCLGFTAQEIADLVEAIEAAQGELCCGPGFPEANAIDQRWSELRRRLLDGERDT